MRSLRTISSVAALAVAGVVLAGCAGSGPSDATTGDLTFINDKTWDFKKFSKVSEEDIDVKLVPTSYADQEAFQAFVKQSFRTNKSPGLFTWHTGGQLEELVAEDLVAETTDIWTEAIENGDVAESVRDLYTIDGKQYCTPISVDDWVMYYDKRTFSDLGLEPPTNWDELMDVADALVDGGVAPFWNSSGNPWAFVWFQILTAGTDLELYHDLTTGEASFTDPRVVDIMNTWLDMKKKGYFTDPGSKVAAETQMKDQQVAMIPFGTWYASTLDTVGLKSGEDWGVFPIPNVNPEQAVTPVAIETAPACVAETSNQKALGLEYSKWWMSTEAQTAWSEQQGNLPYNPHAEASTEEFKAIGEEFAKPDYEFYLRYYEAAPAPILTASLDQFTGFMTNPGDPTPYLEGIEKVAAEHWAGD
ncbi:multiple sugar transport system substrate-binding protein [Diaminobutyricimonas aerilata]|uniref:Multiple sugar transport system substrate-binding protein n=1 Tax=Diaminobutyricimonas aerilata TaxID=1162967 RepID=A0A2M9CHG2_9MICO|nr:extracellular solute-binding protein [Diaminobutyricimonas aerilata]PJJ71353.1 multiple sugar transport system substrate-binding protein [Diaminobutyricimonas aerilata]